MSRSRTGRWLRRWRLVPALVIVALLAAWETLARAGAISSLLFPAPSAIGGTIFRMVVTGRLLGHLAVTLERMFLGLAVGGLAGAAVGMAMGWSRLLRVLVDPFIAVFHPLPKIAILPLVMVLIGLGELPKVVLVAFSTFFPMAIGAMSGVRHIDPVHFEVARNFHASRWKVFSRVVLPGSLPMLLAGARLAVNLALVITIAVEMVAAQRGLGNLIWFAWQTMRTEELYATIFVTGAFGIAFSTCLQLLHTRLVPWHVERTV